MRQKSQKLIVTFYTTVSAMAAEQHCQAAGIAGRLIPVPRAITADCGMAWCCETALRTQLAAALEAAGIQPAGYYELMV